MRLDVDAAAHHLLSHVPSGDAILITIVNSYGLPRDALAIERCPLAWVARDPDVVLVDSAHGAPIYAHRRVADYARWQPLRVTGRGAGWWHVLSLVDGDETWRNLRRWEIAHPGLRRPDDWDPTPRAA